MKKMFNDAAFQEMILPSSDQSLMMVVARHFECCPGIFVINLEQILPIAFTVFEVYPETCQTSKAELFVKIGGGFQPLRLLQKVSS